MRPEPSSPRIECMGRWLIVAILSLVAVGGACAQPERVFDIGSERPKRAVLMLGDSTESTAPSSAMVSRLHGELARLGPQEVAALRGCVPREARWVGDPPGAERIGVLHLIGRRSKRVEILRGADGWCVAKDLEMPGDGPACVELERVKMEEVTASWPAYRGTFDSGPGDQAVGAPFELVPPLTPGWFAIDVARLSERLYAGGELRGDPASRKLDEETLVVRLPRGFDRRVARGLVVWVSPEDKVGVPESFAGALDELGMICVGALKSGNTRHISDRYQLALDGVATVCERYLIDRERIYVTGMSGGGRTASMLVAGFPDVFAGAVPIVGLSCHRAVPRGDGAYWPPGFLKPTGKQWSLVKERPIAAITGELDSNYLEIVHAARIMSREGMNVRVFEYEDMAHDMPTPERFFEALAWADERARNERRSAEERAAALLEEYDRTAADGKPRSNGREMLVKITDIAPWTAPAWGAVERLGRLDSGDPGGE